MSELATDVIIVGGGTGGVAAALAVARMGGRCVVVEPTRWIGGQLTNQAVPPDENRWIEGVDGVQSATRSYLEFRSRCRQWYRNHRTLTPAAAADPRLNPGNGWVSWLCVEPRVAHSVLREMLAPHIHSGAVRVMTGWSPTRAEVDGDVIRAVHFSDGAGAQCTVTGRYVLDASETGELLPLAGVEYAVGAEHRDTHGELHARTDRAEPSDQQAISWCFALEHRPGETHTIDRPASYGFWRDYVPEFAPGERAWPGRLFSWSVIGGEGHTTVELPLVPWPDEPQAGRWELWRYRRIVDRSIYAGPEAGQPASGAADLPPDVSLINCVQMDYWQRPTLDVSADDYQKACAEAKDQALCFLYWMQTDAPRHDGGTGYPGLKLRGLELGTEDGFAMAPYIREARRMKARVTVTEAHVGMEQRRAEGRAGMDLTPLGSGEPFADSVGVGHYRLDLHPSTGGRNSVYAQATPFRIPLGALIPVRVVNLLAAGKCLGVTHVTNGGYRLHPVEWNVGEAAGALAAWCVARGDTPARVWADRDRLRAYQAELVRQGFALAWPWEQGQGL